MIRRERRPVLRRPGSMRVGIGLLMVWLCGPMSALGQTQTGSAPPLAGSGLRLRFDDRPVLEIGEAIRIELGGRVDETATRRARETREGTEWGVAGRRLEVTGRITTRVAFEVSREMGETRGAWRDLFVDVETWGGLALRAGQFKVPFTEERTRGAGKLDFVNRSLAATVLAPGRDVGVMGLGRLAGKRVSYDVGLFQGKRPEVTDVDPISQDARRARLAAARLTYRPFGSAKGAETLASSLRVGASVLRGSSRMGLTTLEAETFGRRGTLLDPVYVSGPRTGLGVEAQWTPGPFRLAAEWIELREARQGQAIDGTDLDAFVGRGWYVGGLWRVVSSGRDSRLRHWLRSLDLGARFEVLSLGTGAGPADSIVHPRAAVIPWRTLHAATLGATWALNRWSRVQVNAIAEQAPGGGRDWSGVAKFQVQM